MMTLLWWKPHLGPDFRQVSPNKANFSGKWSMLNYTSTIPKKSTHAPLLASLIRIASSSVLLLTHTGLGFDGKGRKEKCRTGKYRKENVETKTFHVFFCSAFSFQCFPLRHFSFCLFHQSHGVTHFTVFAVLCFIVESGLLHWRLFLMRRIDIVTSSSWRDTYFIIECLPFY
jgi:hypothetical protein